MPDSKHRLAELLKKQTWTEGEKAWLRNYLEHSEEPELRELMQEQFGRDAAAPVLPHAEAQRLLQEIHKGLGIGERKAPVVKLWVRRLAVAAAVLLVVGLAWTFLLNKPNADQVAQQPTPKAAGTPIALRREVNTTGKEKQIQLPDGSVVFLADQSELAYQQPFVGRRDITLTGKAFFKVAKDSTRPFSVISGDIATTALGTEFTVTTYRNLSRIVVRLYEGHVVVRSTGNNVPALKAGVHLAPGQQLVYNRGKSDPYTLGWFRLNKSTTSGRVLDNEMAHDNPSIPRDAGSWYMFNNQSLVQVFDQLAEMYNAEISYDPKKIQNLYFIGRFDRTRSLEQILNQIAKLNDLTIAKDGDRFVISR